MKKLIAIAICAVFLFSCSQKETVVTDEAETNVPKTAVTTAETTAQTDGFSSSGVDFTSYPCEDFELLFVHTVFPSMGNYIVFGLVDGKPKEVFAYYTNDQGETYTRIDCTIPEGIEYDSAIPVYSGHGGGSNEVQFAVLFESENDKTYVAYDNFAYTDYTDWLIFNSYIITEETHDYIFEEINKSLSCPTSF